MQTQLQEREMWPDKASEFKLKFIINELATLRFRNEDNKRAVREAIAKRYMRFIKQRVISELVCLEASISPEAKTELRNNRHYRDLTRFLGVRIGDQDVE